MSSKNFGLSPYIDYFASDVFDDATFEMFETEAKTQCQVHGFERAEDQQKGKSDIPIRIQRNAAIRRLLRDTQMVWPRFHKSMGKVAESER
jgi:hypothetical protein